MTHRHRATVKICSKMSSADRLPSFIFYCQYCDLQNLIRCQVFIAPGPGSMMLICVLDKVPSFNLIVLLYRLQYAPPERQSLRVGHCCSWTGEPNTGSQRPVLGVSRRHFFALLLCLELCSWRYFGAARRQMGHDKVLVFKVASHCLDVCEPGLASS